MVCDICYAAKKYMLPALVEECTNYLWRDLYPRNACRAYEFAKLFEEPVLLDKSLQLIRNQSREILSEPTFEDIEHSTLCIVLGQPVINADELSLFEAMVRISRTIDYLQYRGRCNRYQDMHAAPLFLKVTFYLGISRTLGKIPA